MGVVPPRVPPWSRRRLPGRWRRDRLGEVSWTRAFSLDELTRPRVLKTAGRQIAVVRDGESVAAIDNLCPHEGYPLHTGPVKDGLLTCEWHNWKFRLADGKCVLGGEDVRTYPTKVEDGVVFVRIEEPPRESEVPRLYASLGEAYDDGDFGRVAREVARLMRFGEPAPAIVAHGCVYAATHDRYGFDHGMATAADLLGSLRVLSEEAPLVVTEALSLLVEPLLRERVYPFPEAEPLAWVGQSADPEDPAWRAIEAELRRRVEAEEREAAEALLRGAIEAGAPPRVVHRWLVHAATDHFLSFGHAQIYCVKAEELLGEIGWVHAHPVLSSLVRRIVTGTREDRLPYMKAYRRRMEVHTPRLEAWAGMGQEGAALPASEFIETVLDGGADAALDAVADALDRGVTPARIALALGVAAAERMLRFDTAIEDAPVAEGWLYLSHLLTHADAVWATLRRRPSAEALRGLFHSARFVEHEHPLDLPPERRSRLGGRPLDPEAPDAGTMVAVLHHDPEAAMASAEFAFRERREALFGALVRAYVSDHLTVPIFIDHQIKTTAAAIRLSKALALDAQLAPWAERPILALVRFLAHPLQERRIRRRVRDALRFVWEGKVPESILPY